MTLWLADKIANLSKLAEKRKCFLRIEVKDPASQNDILSVEQFIGKILPPQLRTFLEVQNGMSLTFCTNGPSASWEPYKLEVLSSKDIIRYTESDRRVFNGLDYEALKSNTLRETLHSCIDIASNWQQLRIAYMLQGPSLNGEYKIIEADMTVCMNWLEYIEDEPAKIHVADSFDEYLRRSIEFMLETEGGFRYWDQGGPDTTLWDL